MINRRSLAIAASLNVMLALSAATSSTAAQSAGLMTTQPPPPVAAAAPSAPAAPAHARIPEGTQIKVHLGERLSSATSAVGDTFVVISDEEVRTPDGTVIPAGYSGRGEVTVAEKNGMLGKSGQLGVRLNYLKVGDTHIHLRANKAAEEASGVTNTVILTVLFGPLGLLVHGHSVVYSKGTPLTAYVDEDTVIDLPISAPPVVD
jgi:hypothetical protein